MTIFTPNGVEVSGEIGTVRIRVQAVDERGLASEDVGDNSLYSQALRVREYITAEVERLVAQDLGDSFRALSVRIGPGSALIDVVVGSVTVLLAFSRYESLVKSINLLVSHVTNLALKYFVEPKRRLQGLSIVGIWEQGSVRFPPATAPAPKENGTQRFLVIYLVVNHALLSALLFWFLLHRLV